MRVRYRGYQGFRMNAIWGLIVANLLVFIITRLVPGLFPLLGLMPAVVLERPWTVLTSIFLHGGLWHILANMYMLYFFGNSVYRLVGKGRFLAVYFGGGIVGSILYIILASPFSLAVGASGAVFALGGVLAMMTPKTKVFIFPIPVPFSLWIAVIGGFLVLSFAPSIAWQAHLGGLLLGLGAGYYFKKRLRYFIY
ncbi:MAG: rhomboid family intramembrane serine protease [Dehalococcoidales bacterium]